MKKIGKNIVAGLITGLSIVSPVAAFNKTEGEYVYNGLDSVIEDSRWWYMDMVSTDKYDTCRTIANRNIEGRRGVRGVSELCDVRTYNDTTMPRKALKFLKNKKNYEICSITRPNFCQVSSFDFNKGFMEVAPTMPFDTDGKGSTDESGKG